jgi:UDP-N-acetylmuramoyl-L-alanyl-D-glutamate--2,6-diaminopimelate ligase
VEPFHLDLELDALGRSMIGNAAIAATTALVLGADHDAVREALAAFPSPRRRMEILQEEPYLILDDTSGHPDSIGAVFEVVERLGRARVHAVFAIRGRRGVRINRRSAEALGIWAKRVELETLVITSSAGAADELNTVEPRERQAFLDSLSRQEAEFEEIDRLDDAVRRVLSRAAPGDLVLLLGAQGMDEGAELARRFLQEG